MSGFANFLNIVKIVIAAARRTLGFTSNNNCSIVNRSLSEKSNSLMNMRLLSGAASVTFFVKNLYSKNSKSSGISFLSTFFLKATIKKKKLD
jgi:hypothetical protein